MNAQRLLAEFQVFARPDFLSNAECTSLRREADAGRRATAERYDNDSGKNTANENTFTATLLPATAELPNRRFEQLKPALERHFGLELKGWDAPTVFVYEQGAGLKPHRDVHPDSPTHEPERVRRRKVSVVVFLNAEDELPGPEEFRGGHLRLYDLGMSEQDTKPRGIGVRPRKGLLVAFKSALPHEVTRVTEGTRYCLIAWFH